MINGLLTVKSTIIYYMANRVVCINFQIVKLLDKKEEILTYLRYIRKINQTNMKFFLFLYKVNKY